MSEVKKGLVLSMYLAVGINVILIISLTLLGEFDQPFKAWLGAIFGHPWVGKSVISVVVFVVICMVFTPVLKSGDIKSLVKISAALVSIISLGLLIIGSYYLIHFIAG